VRTTATAEARTNIALVKYWGKRDAALNLPAAGSLSLTLDGLVTRTTVTLDETQGADTLILGGEPQVGEPLARVMTFLDEVRARAGARIHARVDSANSFPTASGLASSASAFAALALAATRAYGLELSPTELSALARRGSGSAARSIFGGFVELVPDGDAHAVPLADWPEVRLVVAVVAGGVAKSVSSRSGMDHTALTSPLYPGFLATVPADLAAARDAIARHDLAALGEVAERSALTMHASALAARPGVLYWRGATVEGLHAVRALRQAGVGAWATIDAGPHVKVLCAPADAARVAAALRDVSGVTETMIAAPGAAARVLP
jgi:diphosphomevalonate decarboxylase